MRIENELLLDFKDVLIRPKRSTLKSRSEVSIRRTYKFKYSNIEFKGVPILASNLDTTGTVSMAKSLYPYECGTLLHKFYSIDILSNFFMDEKSKYTWYTTGIGQQDEEKYSLLIKSLKYLGYDKDYLPYICIDVANGYQESVVEFVKKFRSKNENSVIMVGNVVTPDMTEALILAGADLVKVGIGNGGFCTTRLLTGVGYPQLSALIETADAAHGLKGHIVCDGGCAVPGDVSKAFGAGSDFVILGSLFSGHDESECEILVDEKGNKKIKSYGMSSKDAMEKHYGSKAEYRAAEGKTVLVPYKGPIKNTIEEILGGVRSMMTYIGASNLKEVSKRTTFVRVSMQANEIFGKSN